MVNMKLGIFVFANDSGLGAQTRRLTYMLKPDRILAIDSSSFSKNKEQHFDWYNGFDGYKVQGFPTDREVRVFLKNLTHVLVCENPLNHSLMRIANNMGVKVFIQSNWEFCDHLNRPHLEHPYKFLMPSYWKVKEMKDLFGVKNVVYLPPPINPNEFKNARERNFERKNNAISTPKFLHIVGTLAANDRNGTLDLLDAMRFSKERFELTIRSQRELPQEYMIDDPRVKYDIGNIKDAQDMYYDFDALILPRRYGGLSLTTCESLMSGLPVFMTDISPNNELLPKEWLVKSAKKGEFITRTMISIYGPVIKKLAEKLDWICNQDLDKMKIEAFSIGYDSFSESVLKPKYEELFK